MRMPLVAGNWKMNGSRQMVEELLNGLIAAGPFDCEVAVFPPSIFLEHARRLVTGSVVKMGAQNLDWHDGGAFTGEISGTMIREAGCDYCIVGHSERRQLFGETDEMVAEKFSACLKVGLVPVLCVGELLEEREADQTVAVVARQLDAVIQRVGIQGLKSAVLAYEPIWAIGTGESATSGQAETVHRELRSLVARHDAETAAKLRILYGGSVNAENAAGLLAQKNIDGALVGGASLKAEAFASICKATK